MRKWLYDNPWIWIVVFLSVLVTGSITTVVIAELNRPPPQLANSISPRLTTTGSNWLLIPSWTLW